jgi:hypothetical protein
MSRKAILVAHIVENFLILVVITVRSQVLPIHCHDEKVYLPFEVVLGNLFI